MTVYKWYFIFNRTEFLALGLVSKTYSIILENLGQKDILVTSGNKVGLVYDDVFLTLDTNEKNPLEFEGYALYEDADNQVFLGIEVEDEE